MEDILSTGLGVAIVIVGALIVIMGLVSGITSVILFFKYISLNRKHNGAKIAGRDLARRLLDENGLENIKVSATGSLMFGNSYSHYFHKVRLRRMTYKKDSLTSMAMAAQKTGLAILDKEGDPDMRIRVKLTPVIAFGPLAFIPLMAIGLILDIVTEMFLGQPVFTIIFSSIGIVFYIFALVMSIKTLKTEKKAQSLAFKMLKEREIITSEEEDDVKELFHLYNIEYINNIIMSTLELIYRILILVLQFTQNSSSSSVSSD